MKQNKIEKQIQKLVQSIYPRPASLHDKNYIRSNARAVLAKAKISKQCEICGFSEIVEVCHIIPISAFPKEASISLINNLLNLVYLCPNHHAMLDKGLISIDQLKLIVPRLR